MTTKRRLALLSLGSLLLTGCSKPVPPPSDILNRGIVESLLDTGFYADVSMPQIIGRHYNPGEDQWTIYACFDFALDDGNRGSTCVDSIVASRLESGGWIVATTINEVYRWRAIGAPSMTPPAAGQAQESSEP